jgi:hypothetical protein
MHSRAQQLEIPAHSPAAAFSLLPTGKNSILKQSVGLIGEAYVVELYLGETQ